jgi:uncharacterized protein (DUF305 family)
MHELVLHHTIAIQNAERCVDRAHDGDLITICEEIIKTQKAEIEQLRTWLCKWYDRCRGNMKKDTASTKLSTKEC